MRRLVPDLTPVEQEELEGVLRRQYVVRDHEQFITSFDPFEGDTLDAALEDLITHFREPDGDGYEETDMVIWQDARIVAVVRRGQDGSPVATVFRGSPSLSIG